MLKRFRGNLWRQWREMRRFNALDFRKRAIVFYAEDAGSWVHFAPIIRELTGPMGREICYLTSSQDDPVLQSAQPNIHAFYIGSGVVRTTLFMVLRAGVLVMTMPDLMAYQVKRSKVHPVHYAYVFHSMCSTHMIYRKGAFDHYDTIMCVGPHHTREIRATEEAYGLPRKELIEHGYSRLDSMCRKIDTFRAVSPADNRWKKHVLVAPSWGPHGLLETRGVALIRFLLDAGYRVTVRPHPMTAKKWPMVIREIRRHFEGKPGFCLETDIGSSLSLESADIMMSDWSGAAMEYAFVFERPVLFVDVPRKVNNPDYLDIQWDPLEVSIRDQIGELISLDKLEDVSEKIERLCSDPDAFQDRIRDARSRSVYNVGTSGVVGASYVAQIADRVSKQKECAA